MNPANWKSGEVGVNVGIGSFTIKYRNPLTGAKTNQMKIQPPIAKSTGETDMRFSIKNRPIIGGAAISPKSKVAAKGLLLLVALDFGLKVSELALYKSDATDISDQKELLILASHDLSQAIEEGLIDKDFLNLQDLTNILNVIFQGESNSDKEGIQDIGISIFDRYNPNSEKAKERSRRAEMLRFYNSLLREFTRLNSHKSKGEN